MPPCLNCLTSYSCDCGRAEVDNKRLFRIPHSAPPQGSFVLPWLPNECHWVIALGAIDFGGFITVCLSSTYYLVTEQAFSECLSQKVACYQIALVAELCRSTKMHKSMLMTLLKPYYYSNERITVRNTVYYNGHQMAPEAAQALTVAFSPLSSSKRQSSL